MKLRGRVALVTALVALPAILVQGRVHAYLRQQAGEEALQQLVLGAMQDGGRGECEKDPAVWIGRLGQPSPRADAERGRGSRHGGPTELYAFDAALVARNPSAPALDDALRAAMADGAASASRAVEVGERRARDLLLRMPWGSGGCAFVLARRLEPPNHRAPVLPPLGFWLTPVLIIIGSVLLSVTPILRRVEALKRAVLASAQARYETSLGVGGKDEIGELARAFESAGNEVRAQMRLQEEREKALRDFLENTTHDVMIPLTVLQGHLAAMEEKLGAGVDPAVLASAMNEAEYIGSLVHNLGVAAKLEAGEPRLSMHPLDLSGVVSRVVGRHGVLARHKGVSLEQAEPEHGVMVFGDVTMVEQAVSNLVSNAIRYNRPGGHVAVVLEHKADRTFSLRVIDDGPGLPDDELARLGERYFRGNRARTREPGGRGLGLNIAHRVASAHGFALKLQRSEFGGLQVSLSGPVVFG